MLNRDIKQIINQSETIEQLQFAEDLLRTKIRSIRELIMEAAQTSVLSNLINSVITREGLSEDDVLTWGPKVQAVYNALNEKTQKKSEDEQSNIKEMEKMIKDSQNLIERAQNKMRDIIWSDAPAPSE